MSANVINQHADQVEELHGTGQIYSLTWHAGDTPQQRAWLINHHGAVQTELRRRGHIVHAKVVRDEADTEHYAVRLAPWDGENNMADL